MHTYKLNKVLDFKVMGQMEYDQTVCLVAVAQVVAEGHSRDYRKCRNLTQERNQQSIRTTNTKRIQKPKCSK